MARATGFRLTLLILLVLAVGVVLGMWVAGQRLVQDTFVARVERKAVAVLRSGLTSGQESTTQIEPNRLPLTQRVVNLPLSVAYYGGGIDAAPGGGVLILDRLGRVHLFDKGEMVQLNVETPDNGLEALIEQHALGLLGDKGFRPRGFRFNDVLVVDRKQTTDLLISYSDWDAERLCYRSVLAKASVPNGIAPVDWSVGRTDWDILHVTEPCLPPLTVGHMAVQGIEAGGRLARLSGDSVVWSVGAYEWDDAFRETGVPPYAQREGSDYGRVFRVHIDTGETVSLARGLRNPQGLAVSGDGRIWLTDHGMRGGDELNVIEPSRAEYNFGWPYVTFGTHYNLDPAGGTGRHTGHEGYDLPLVSFVPSIAPGTVIYLGDFHPAWNGDVLIGGLRGTLERVHVVDGRAILVESLPTGVRSRDMLLTDDGQIVILTDHLQLIILRPSVVPTATDRVFSAIDDVVDTPLRQPVADLFEACLQCHQMVEGGTGAGPSLHGVCGAKPGQDGTFQQYSEALKNQRDIWSEDRLAAFIANPQSVVPDNRMAWDGADRKAAELVARLLCQTL
ncbi:MAG: PQQ-dependent sugar dehydrogenase [Paracoccaceae bacterium]